MRSLYTTDTYALSCVDFLNRAVTSFHAVQEVAQHLREAGYVELVEGQSWDVSEIRKAFVMRNHSSLIAFHIPKSCSVSTSHVQLTASHSDSPTYKLKHYTTSERAGHLCCLNLEPYGGLLDATWFDRPLHVAGRVFVEDKTTHTAHQHLWRSQEPVALLPSMSIHLNRGSDCNPHIAREQDCYALIAGSSKDSVDFLDYVAQDLHVERDQILSHDLFLAVASPAYVWGMNHEFISSGRLDNLASVFASLTAFLGAPADEHINMLAIFDNEEVGSLTKQGADSTFLSDTLHRMYVSLGLSEDERLAAYARSYLVSCDNAQGMHPNHPELYDAQHPCYLNGGLALKQTASQTYCTDALSMAPFRMLMDHVHAPYQVYANRTDMRGGSTLGNISNAQVSLTSIDVGIPQISMHASFETLGTSDLFDTYRVLSGFFTHNLSLKNPLQPHWEFAEEM